MDSRQPHVLRAENMPVQLQISLLWVARRTQAREHSCVSPFEVLEESRKVVLHRVGRHFCATLRTKDSFHELDRPAYRPRDLCRIECCIEGGNALPQQCVDPSDLALQIG